MTIVCGECGSKNDDDSDFCATCGEPLEWTGVRGGEEAAAAAAVAEAPPVVAAPPAPAPAAEAPAPPPPAETPVASTPPPPAAPAKSRFGRKPPPPPPSAVPAPPPPVAAAPPEAPPEPVEAPPEPVEPPAPAAADPVDIPAAPPSRVPPPRRPAAPSPEVDEEEAARLAAEAEQQRREEAARRLVVPVERPVAAPVVAAPVVVEAPPEKLTWWQRFVRWFKRVILRRKPAVAAAAVAAPVVADAPAPSEPGEPSVAARPPEALKPGEEYQRRTPRAVEEEAPVVKPGDLVCVNCGTGNDPTNKFCKRCGKSLAEAPIAKKPSWIKRFFGFFAFRKKRKYAAGERKKKQLQQQEGGGKGGKVFWRLQGVSFKMVGAVMLVVAGLAAYAAFGSTITDRFKSNYTSLRIMVLPHYKAVTGQRATASSHLSQKHSAGKAIDLVLNTSWISAPRKNNGKGEILTIHLGEPTRVGKIGLDNGDQTKGTKTYPLQARVQTMVVVFFDKHGHKIEGKSKKCNFPDTLKFQTCGMDVKNVKILKAHITRVYPSQKGKSVAISEFEVDSKS